jgi:hypothetical protein
MTFQVVIFPNIESADAQQLVDHVQNVNNKNAIDPNPVWVAGTLRWAIPTLRLDGRYDFPILEGQTYPPGFPVEDWDPANYPPDEDD